ncbi:response regulator [Brevundimonas sp. 2R-24]|uniref:histidine kinase n=1 Tax=Peiella sedimenti TaxID=3061083 RepID=A0ABT8SNN5_9CAUL|nr:response regulator [Caulobacteraceae bacterium XZ-24]
MARIGDFIEPSDPVSPDASGGDVYERFLKEPNTMAIAVVGANGQPLGLVERNTLLLKMAAEYGRALYGKRPVERLMDERPLIATADMSTESFFRDVLSKDAAAMLHGFVVVDGGGHYLGVGTALAVMKAGYALHRQRAEEMTRLAQDLAWAEAEATASSRAKSQFLAVMSHEIRTPLNGVLGVARLIEQRLEQAELRPYVGAILESGETLLRLLTDALDLSRAQAGAITFDDQPFSLDALALDLTALWAPACEHKGLGFSIGLEADPGTWALGDAVRIKQVFNNLIGNALKFTEKGGVHVDIAAVRDGVHLRLRGSVRDTGPGIAPDVAESLFEPFRTGREKGHGAGLGLAICRQIVESLSGGIRVDSTPGCGAAFTFEIVLFHVPASESAEEIKVEATSQPVRSGLRVLIADDNPTNRLVASKLLEAAGCECETAVDGRDAVDRAVEGAFDVIFMDIKMPGMDGVEATRAIRASRTPSAATPVIALTANADPDDARLYLAAGMCQVVQKPIRPDQLLAALSAAVVSPDRAVAA